MWISCILAAIIVSLVAALFRAQRIIKRLRQIGLGQVNFWVDYSEAINGLMDGYQNLIQIIEDLLKGEITEAHVLASRYRENSDEIIAIGKAIGDATEKASREYGIKLDSENGENKTS